MFYFSFNPKLNYMNLKNLIVLFTFTFSHFSIFYGQGNQNLTINDLASKVGNVQADKVSYQQTLKVLDNSKGKIEVSVTKVEGEKKTSNYSFEFYLSDIDKNTIISKPSGKTINVELSVQNNLKFIKEFTEGALKEYSSKMQILATDADNARAIIDNLKIAIPQIKPSELQFTTLKDASEWLSKNIGEVKIGTDHFVQSVTYDQAKPYLLTYTQTKTDSKGVATTFVFNFNLDDINKNTITISISGNLMKVKLAIKGNQNFIKVTKNNEPQSYDKDIEIVFDDLDKARNTINALNSAIANTKPVLPTFKSKKEALEKIGIWISKSNAGTNQYVQSFAFDAANPDKLTIILNITEAKGKAEESKFEFYTFDADANLVGVSASGKDAQITLKIKGKVKYIQVFKNNIQQSYDDQIVLHTPDIESARQAAEAFRYIVNNSEYKSQTFKSVSEALNLLKNGISNVTSGATQINQTFEYSSGEPYLLTLKTVKTDSKGASTEESFSFYPYILDSKSSKVFISGKTISLVVKGKDKTKLIRSSKNGEIQNYVGEVEIQFSDILKARDAFSSISNIIDKSAPKAKTWSTKTTAAAFATSGIKDLSIGKTQIKQKMEIVGSDACKFNYNFITVDEKGVSKEEIFEFSMIDINKKKLIIDADGKVIKLKIETKKQEKLIKYYKDSKLQNFSSSLEFIFDDYDLARQVQESLIYAAGECEK